MKVTKELVWDDETRNGDCYMISYYDDLEIQVNYFGKDCYGLIMEYCGDLIFENDISTNINVEREILKMLKKYKIAHGALEFPTEVEFEKIYIESKKNKEK